MKLQEEKLNRSIKDYVIAMQQRGFGSRSYNNRLIRRRIRFEIRFILVHLEARSVIRTATNRFTWSCFVFSGSGRVPKALVHPSEHNGRFFHGVPTPGPEQSVLPSTAKQN